MKVMVKFKIEVLNNMSYGTLSNMWENLITALNVNYEIKDMYLGDGLITKAAETEASIIRINENIDSIKLVMTSKESDALEFFKFGMEPISLN